MDPNFLNDKLDFKIDHYKCVHIDLRKPKNHNFFFNKDKNNDLKAETENTLLSHLIKHFKSLNLKAIWIILPISSNLLINNLYKEDFKFHHTQDDLLYMTKWLLNSPNNLPKYASHFIGVGGIIFNNAGEMLLVKEKTTFKQLEDVWKIPTGLIDKGESIKEGLLREVKEETGLNVKYEGIFNLRETHPYLFGCSDIFIVCVCRLIDDSQKVDINSGDEIKECKWFSENELKKIVRERKLSTFSPKILDNIFEMEKMGNLSVLFQSKPVDVKFLRSRFIFHSPKAKF